jgi:hypothetical protein
MRVESSAPRQVQKVLKPMMGTQHGSFAAALARGQSLSSISGGRAFGFAETGLFGTGGVNKAVKNNAQHRVAEQFVMPEEVEAHATDRLAGGSRRCSFPDELISSPPISPSRSAPVSCERKTRENHVFTIVQCLGTHEAFFTPSTDKFVQEQLQPPLRQLPFRLATDQKSTQNVVRIFSKSNDLNALVWDEQLKEFEAVDLTTHLLALEVQYGVTFRQIGVNGKRVL